MQTQFKFETEGNTEHSTCLDCGKVIRLIWGYVYRNEQAYVAFYARFNEGHLDRGVHLLIVTGPWTPDSKESERQCFSVDCQMGADRPTYMLVDALPGYEELGQPLSRAQALANPFKDELFPMLDQLIANQIAIKNFLNQKSN